MNLQVALILLGLIVLVYVLIFSYLKGRIETSKKTPYWQKVCSMLPARLLSWIKSENPSRAKQDEPSLISASEFRLDPGPTRESQVNAVTTSARAVNERRFESYGRATSQEFQRILKIDYWARLPGTKLVNCHDVLAVYRNHELDFEYPHRIHGQKYPRNVWSDLEDASSADQFDDLIVSVQMVDRNGAITESELTRTNNLVYQLAEKLDRKLQFDMTIEDALGEAKLLDNFCKGHDVLVIVNIVSKEGQSFSGKDVQKVAHDSDMKLGDRGMFHLHDSVSSDVNFTLANRFEPGAIVLDSGEEVSTTGLILFMSIPLVTDPLNVFDTMIAVGQYIALELSGSLQDPESGLIDQKAVEKIRQQVSNIGEAFHRVGILPGSDEAFRLF